MNDLSRQEIVIFAGDDSLGAWTWYDGAKSVKALLKRIRTLKDKGYISAVAWCVDPDFKDKLPGGSERVSLLELDGSAAVTGRRRNIPVDFIEGRRT